MWSDPEEVTDWLPSSRGAGAMFGERVVDKFCFMNNIKSISRAHQLAQEGYQEWFTNKNLVTIWSCPNYCYRCGNLACFMRVDEKLHQKYIQFTED